MFTTVMTMTESSAFDLSPSSCMIGCRLPVSVMAGIPNARPFIYMLASGSRSLWLPDAPSRTASGLEKRSNASANTREIATPKTVDREKTAFASSILPRPISLAHSVCSPDEMIPPMAEMTIKAGPAIP